MRLGATLSVGFHAGIFAVMWFGLPHLRSDPPILDDIVFVKLANLGDVTNVPPDSAKPDEPKPTPKPAPPKAQPKPPPPPVREAAIPPPPPKVTPIQPPKPKPEPAPVVVPPKPLPKPAPPPKSKPDPVAAPAKPAPRPKPRPVAPKPAPKPTSKRVPPKPKAPPVEKKFSSLLKNLKKTRPPELAPVKPKPAPEKSLVERAREAARSRSARAFDPDRNVTVSEIEAVRQQIAQCWNIAAGARQADALSVEIEMVMNPDATVRQAKVVDRMRMSKDPYYRAAAESALRALSHPDCIPLKLPLDKYGIWKTFTFNFDPKDMLR